MDGGSNAGEIDMMREPALPTIQLWIANPCVSIYNCDLIKKDLDHLSTKLIAKAATCK